MRAIYELFGLNPFFSANMAQFLAGIEDLCGEPYGGWWVIKSLYNFYGLFSVVIAGVFFYLKYNFPLFDRAKYSGKGWCWVFAVIMCVFNFAFVAVTLWKTLSTAVLKFECDADFIKLISNVQDVGMVAFVSAVISFLVFVLLSQPRFFRKRLSKNCFEQKLF